LLLLTKLTMRIASAPISCAAPATLALPGHVASSAYPARRLHRAMLADEWDFPPKPKRMRWRTYNRAEERFDRYEAVLDEGVIELAARLGFRM